MDDDTSAAWEAALEERADVVKYLRAKARLQESMGPNIASVVLYRHADEI